MSKIVTLSDALANHLKMVISVKFQIKILQHMRNVVIFLKFNLSYRQST